MKESEKIKAELDAANKEWLALSKEWLALSKSIKNLEGLFVDAVAVELGLMVDEAYRVTQYGKTELGLYGWSTMYYDEVRHFFHRIKLDGSASKNTFYAVPGAKIEKA